MELWELFAKLTPVLGAAGSVLSIVAVYLATELRRERESHNETRLRYETLTEKRYSILETSVEQSKAMVAALGELREQVELLQTKSGRRSSERTGA